MPRDLEHSDGREEIGHLEFCMCEERIDCLIASLDSFVDFFLCLIRECRCDLHDRGHPRSDTHGVEILLQYISCASYTLRLACCDEHIRPFTRGSIDVTWHCEYIASMLECELSGDECPARECSFWYEDATRYRGDELISHREIIYFWPCTEREVRYDCTS